MFTRASRKTWSKENTDISKEEIIKIEKENNERSWLMIPQSKAQYFRGYEEVWVDGKMSKYLECPTCRELFLNSADNSVELRQHRKNCLVEPRAGEEKYLLKTEIKQIPQERIKLAKSPKRKADYFNGYEEVFVDEKRTRFLQCEICKDLLTNAHSNKKTLRAHRKNCPISEIPEMPMKIIPLEPIPEEDEYKKEPTTTSTKEELPK